MDFLSILKDYYYLIGLIIGLFNLSLCIIFLILGRKKESVLAFIDKVLPGFINQAEKNIGSGNGEAKFKYVLGLVATALDSVYKIKDFGVYENYIKSGIETILSTPQKKEVLNG